MQIKDIFFCTEEYENLHLKCQTIQAEIMCNNVQNKTPLKLKVNYNKNEPSSWNKQSQGCK